MNEVFCLLVYSNVLRPSRSQARKCQRIHTVISEPFYLLMFHRTLKTNILN